MLLENFAVGAACLNQQGAHNPSREVVEASFLENEMNEVYFEGEPRYHSSFGFVTYVWSQAFNVPYTEGDYPAYIQLMLFVLLVSLERDDIFCSIF